MTPLVVLLAAIAAFQSGGTDLPIVLRHATLIDGRGGPALPEATIIIENGRIVAVGRSTAGLSTSEVLSIATRNGAQALDILSEAGTIERGKRADLVILEGNPLEDIRNTRRIYSVVLGGVIYRPQDILNSSGRAKRKDR